MYLHVWRRLRYWIHKTTAIRCTWVSYSRVGRAKTSYGVRYVRIVTEKHFNHRCRFYSKVFIYITSIWCMIIPCAFPNLYCEPCGILVNMMLTIRCRKQHHDLVIFTMRITTKFYNHCICTLWVMVRAYWDYTWYSLPVTHSF